MTSIYNIEAFTTENSAVISSLYEELITVKTSKKISLKEKASGFSKTVQKLDKETELIFLEEDKKDGWIKVLTYNRKVWIC